MSVAAPFALLFGAFWGRELGLLLACPQLERDAIVPFTSRAATLALLQQTGPYMIPPGRQLLRFELFVSGVGQGSDGVLYP